MLDDDRGVDAPQQHRVHVDEAGCEDAAGLWVRNCFQVGPVRRGAGSIPAPCMICHAVELAIGWPSLTSSPWTRRCPQVGLPVAIRITSLRIAAAVGGRPGCRRLVLVPFAGDQPPGARRAAWPGHCEYLVRSARGDQPGQCREPQPVGRLVADPADLAAQHRVLVLEHQDPGILGHPTPGQQPQAAYGA